MGTDRLNEQPDLLPVPNESCPYVDNDHPPICQQSKDTTGVKSCLDCPEYLDGLCDLIPYDKKLLTKELKILLALYKKRNKIYDRIGLLHREKEAFSDAIQEQLKRVRAEQGR